VASSCREGPLSPGPADPSLASMLGLPTSKRVLIINADDAGLHQASTDAVIAAFERRLIDSASAMVPCPGFPSLAAWARQNPDADIGIHLTFVSERPALRFGPILPPSEVPSLVDSDGHFRRGWPQRRKVDVSEVEAEARAQIEAAIAAGISPTHLDSHQHVLQRRGPEVYRALVRVARDYRLPFRRSRKWFGRYPYLADPAGPLAGPLDDALSIGRTPVTREDWTRWYVGAVGSLGYGVFELYVHPAIATPELIALMADDPKWGAQWRQDDFDVLASADFGAALMAANVRRIGWRDVMVAARRSPTPLARGQSLG